MSDKNKDHSDGSSKSFWRAFNPGYVVAGVGALWSAYQSINKKFFEGLFNAGVLTEERDSRFSKIRDIFPKRNEDGTFQSIKEFKIAKEEQKVIQEAHHANTAKVLESIGVEHIGHKWQWLKPYEKTEIIFRVGTILTIGLGVVMAYNQDKRLEHKLQKQEQKNTELLQQRH